MGAQGQQGFQDRFALRFGARSRQRLMGKQQRGNGQRRLLAPLRLDEAVDSS